ncbi:MAG: MBL fold metallo-hydrolase [Lachnospiraceae bacterium]|nr:MBL fold metallo-hydrolase [Lachnospiraceae bacterium]
MRIINLIENTPGRPGCAYAHGLSFYIETANHKLLLDLGPSEETLENASKIGIDLTQVDTVVLSHGHYDHSGGLMAFMDVNKNATIYMQKLAGEDYFADDGVAATGATKIDDGENAATGATKTDDGENAATGERYRYIGIDKNILQNPNVKLIQGDYQIDDELDIFTIEKRARKLPFTNKRLLQKIDGSFVRDDFKHEHYLVITDDDKKILLSGCAHQGIISIMEAYHEHYNSYPDEVVSGFHLFKKNADYSDEELQEIRDIAEELKKYPTHFVTCHCTGVPAYEEMKNILGDQLDYVHSGDEVEV